MLENLASGLTSLMTGWTFLYLLAGVVLGLLVGILPALGGTAGMSLLLPFLFGLDAAAALAMMIGMLATVATGDTVTSIILGVPGSASSQATILDGFPLARQGQAARALSAAYFASMLGGIFGAIVLTLVLQGARQVILYFGLPEMLMLVVFGLTSVAALSGTSLSKGLAACALGMLVGSVGAAPATAEYRLDFDIDHFGDGISLIACVLGVFVIPEVVELLRAKTSVSEKPLIGSGALQGVRDVLQNKWLVLRTSGLGCLVGAMPGVGGAVVDWLAYGHAVRSAKDKSEFGKGDIRGVIAVEGSNNAVLGGALIPTLMFGVPGSGSTALFLSGLILIGIQPGPGMLQNNLDFTYSIIWSLAIANVIGAAACFALSGWFARLTTIPFVWLAPFLVLTISFATLQISREPLDLVVLGLFGALGFYLRRFAYSRPAFLIGLVLQDNLEVFLYQAAQVYDLSSFFSRPLVWLLGTIIVFTLATSLLRKDVIDTEVSSTAIHVAVRTGPQFAVPIVFLGIFVLGAFALSNLSALGRLFPTVVTILGGITSLIVIVSLYLRRPKVMIDQEEEVPAGYPGALRPLCWITGALSIVWLIGFVWGAALFLLVFLLIEAGANLSKAIVATTIGAGAFWAVAQAAGVNLPAGLLF